MSFVNLWYAMYCHVTSTSASHICHFDLLLPKYDRQYSRPARLINNNNNIITVDREISKKLLISIIFTFTTFRNLGNPENSHVHETYIPTGLVCQVMSNNDIYSVKYVQTYKL